MRKLAMIALVAAGTLAGCATPKQPARVALIEKPINCATARNDIAELEAAIPTSAEKIAARAGNVVPVSRIAGRVTGQLEERQKVASGQTEDEIRKRIAAIEAACPGSAEPGAK